jgi:hypothetical protein
MDEINENVISFACKDVYTLKLLYMAMVSINININMNIKLFIKVGLMWYFY